jgi:hypothetical protein
MAWLVGLAVVVFLFTTETGIFLMISLIPSLIISTIMAYYIKGPGDSILVLGTLLGTALIFAALKGWSGYELRLRRRWGEVGTAPGGHQGSHHFLEGRPVPRQLQSEGRVPFEEREGF